MAQKWQLRLMSSVLLSVVLLERFHHPNMRVVFCAKMRAAVDTFQPVNTLQADEAPHDATFFLTLWKICVTSFHSVSQSLRLFLEFIFLLLFSRLQHQAMTLKSNASLLIDSLETVCSEQTLTSGKFLQALFSVL